MKHPIKVVFLIVLMAIASPCLSQSGAEMENARFKLRVESAASRSQGPERIVISLRYDGGAPIYRRSYCPLDVAAGYELEVTYIKSGEKLVRRPDECRGIGRTELYWILPGTTDRRVITLSDIFDLKRRGKYSLRVVAILHDAKGKEPVVELDSKLMTLTVN